MDKNNKKKTVIVTGFFGSPAEETARILSRDRNLPLVILDEEIEAADGRSVKRICMTEGEHSYRNKDFEMLEAFAGKECVILCGDGVLHDDMSRELIADCELVISGSDMSPDELWNGAKAVADTTYHAFMLFGTEEEKRTAFDKLLERQKILFKGESDD